MRIFAISALLFSSAVSAQPIKWTLNDVVFDDGGTLSGYFVFDADSQAISEVSISSTSGANGPAQIYNTTVWSTGQLGYVDDEKYTVLGFDSEGSTNLNLVLSVAGHLSNSGGSYDLLLSGCTLGNLCSNEDYENNPVLERYAVSGSISAVPLPAGVWLLASSLALLGRKARSAK